MKKTLALMFIAATVSACAVQDGVIKTPNGDLRIVTEQATGFATTPEAMKSDVSAKAASHCAQSGQDVEVLSIKATEPPYTLGNFPSAQIDFRCKPR
jgi:hypothetical protein